MKALNKSRGSIVLATILFAVGGVGIADAVGIDGATKSGNNPNYIGAKSPSGAKVTISESGSDTVGTKTVVYGGYTNGTDNVLNNSVKVDNTTLSIASIQAGYSTLVGDGTETTTRQVNSNSIHITGSILSASMWAGRADKSYAGEAKYNTTVIDKLSEINHNQLRGAIVYSSNGKAEYNTLSVKDSTMYAHGNSFEITGAMGQADDTTKPVTVSFNQLIYEGVTTYAHTNKGATSKYLFGSATRVGEVKDNRVYVKNLNKDVGNSVAIETNVVGGATYRPNSGGATGNIAVATGESKIANIYGGAVGLASSVGALGEDVYENGKQKLKLDSQGNYILPITGKTDGTNNNLAILDLSDAGIVNENVYGGYVSDKYDVTRKLEGTDKVEVIDTILYDATTNSYDATTKDNAVYFMSGTVAGSVIGGSREATGNTLILGKDKDNLGKVKAGQISNFNTLQFNAFAHGDTADKATLTLTNPQIGADLDGVAINVLKGDASGAVEVLVGGDNGVGVNEKRNNGGGENAITNLTKNAIKYGTNLDKIAIITGGAQANNDIEETLTRSRTDEEYQAKYGIGDTFNYTYDVIDLNKEKNKKFYLIKSATSLQNIIPDPNNNIKGIDINWQNKEHSGETLANGAKIVDVFQPDQIYKILSSKKYTRNLRGIYLEKNDENLYFTGTDEIPEEWSDSKFDTNEFAKFNQPSNTGNHVYVETNIQTGDLVGKTIYGGYSDNDDVSNNNIYINQNAKLSNATIIGGYSAKGNVSGNKVDLNAAQIDSVDIVLGDTDSGTIGDNTLSGTDKAKVKSLTVARSVSSELKGLSYEIPKNLEIAEDFILANSTSGNTSDNNLTIANGVKAKNIYVGKTKSGNAENNVVDFDSGVVSGTIHGGKSDTGTSSGNKLNVNSNKLKAGNVADFQVMNFKQDYLASTTSESEAALTLTAGETTNLKGVKVQIGGKKYAPKEKYGLSDGTNKYYLINNEKAELDKWKELDNYNKDLGAAGSEVTHSDGKSSGFVVDAIQNDTKYIIDDAKTFKRNLSGMFVGSDKTTLYLTQGDDIIEEIKDTIGGDDFFTKFGGPESGNTITIAPKKGNELDLGDVTLDGGTKGGNTLNIGTDKNHPASVKAKDVTRFDDIYIYLPNNPKDEYAAIALSGGAGTDLSRSTINVFVDSLETINDNGGTVHLVKADNPIAKNAQKTKVQVGALLTFTNTIKQTTDNTLDLFAKKPDPKPDPKPSINDQTKIFNEARIAGMAAVWEGSYLISNHLERITPDGYTELFPYAIVEGYDKRYNTGSHVDSLGFNANAGLAGKAPNSKGEFTMGIFIEYGNVDYDAYLDDGTKGSGDAYYAGVGAFGKQENASGSYFEGSFRVGQLTTNFDGTLNFNGVSKYYDWGIDSTYYAVHVGGGKIVPLSESNDLDFYARYFYTHIDAADIKIDGVDTHFDALQSHKIRAGLQDNFKIDEHNKFFVGLAGEYEFSSESDGRFIVPNGNTGEMLSPDLKGLTGIGEIGYQYKTETLKFDAGVKGYAGKQEGVSAQMALSIAF